MGGGYSRTVTKSQPYRGLGLVTWADRAADGGLDVDVYNLPTPTTRDYKDTSIGRANHRPDDKDTLSRALAHLENDE